MDKKRVLVTGGMGGIGTAICRRFCADGYAVATTYIHDSGRETRWLQEQEKAGFGGLRAHFCDVSDWESCVALRQKIEEDMGGVDVLVNNAGITRDAVMAKMGVDDWRAVLDANLSSAFNITKQFLDGMTARGFGRIVNISSVNGQKGQFGQVNYSAAKAGLHGLTKALAQEVVKKGVTVNTVSPGYIGTQMVLSIREEVREKIRAMIPVGRFGKPEEIAHAIAFLAHDDSGFITGANLSINGGQHMF